MTISNQCCIAMTISNQCCIAMTISNQCCIAMTIRLLYSPEHRGVFLGVIIMVNSIQQCCELGVHFFIVCMDMCM